MAMDGVDGMRVRMGIAMRGIHGSQGSGWWVLSTLGAGEGNINGIDPVVFSWRRARNGRDKSHKTQDFVFEAVRIMRVIQIASYTQLLRTSYAVV